MSSLIEVKIKANNYYNEGWLFGMLNLQPREFDNSTPEEDVESWWDGYYKVNFESTEFLEVSGTFSTMIDAEELKVTLTEENKNV